MTILTTVSTTATTVSIIPQETIDSLSILIKLNCGKCLPELEKEIFSNTYLSNMYINLLFYDPRYTVYPTTPQWFAFVYANNVMKERWRNAEQFIKTDRDTWKFYRENFNFIDVVI